MIGRREVCAGSKVAGIVLPGDRRGGFFGQGSWTELMLLEQGRGGLAVRAGCKERRIEGHHIRIMQSPLRLPEI